MDCKRCKEGEATYCISCMNEIVAETDRALEKAEARVEEYAKEIKYNRDKLWELTQTFDKKVAEIAKLRFALAHIIVMADNIKLCPSIAATRIVSVAKGVLYD